MQGINNTAQILITVLPIVAIVALTILLFFFLLWRHRETMCLIKMNNYKEHIFNYKVFSLLAGIILSAVGLVLTIVFLFASKNMYSLLGGLIPLVLGIGLLIFYTIIKNKKDF